MAFFDFLYARQNDMASWANELEMSYVKESSSGINEIIDSFRLMDKGGRRRVKNLMRKGHELDDYEESIFDYQYTTSNGKSSSTHKTTVIFINSKSLLLPSFYMRPRNKLGKWWSRIRDKNQGPGATDQLNYHYKVKMEDESKIEFLVASGINDLLLTDKIYTVEGFGHYFIIYKHEKLLDLKQILNMQTTAYKIFDFLKANSWYV